ncbi:hypothetical protein JXB27_03625 [Candidatus Woesearchaeota archaeon]|nr:hypothetical protein [Candidatus Woesearchaeota archaeon]
MQSLEKILPDLFERLEFASGMKLSVGHKSEVINYLKEINETRPHQAYSEAIHFLYLRGYCSKEYDERMKKQEEEYRRTFRSKTIKKNH